MTVFCFFPLWSIGGLTYLPVNLGIGTVHREIWRRRRSMLGRHVGGLFLGSCRKTVLSERESVVVQGGNPTFKNSDGICWNATLDFQSCAWNMRTRKGERLVHKMESMSTFLEALRCAKGNPAYGFSPDGRPQQQDTWRVHAVPRPEILLQWLVWDGKFPISKLEKGWASIEKFAWCDAAKYDLGSYSRDSGIFQMTSETKG